MMQLQASESGYIDVRRMCLQTIEEAQVPVYLHHDGQALT